jgi:nucleoid DNA-binding protein
MSNKKTLSKKLAKRTLLSQNEAVDVVEELFKIILEEVLLNEEVNIVGFGKFYLYHHTQRPVRNPKTNKEFLLEEHKTLRFKTSERVNNKIKNK